MNCNLFINPIKHSKTFIALLLTSAVGLGLLSGSALASGNSYSDFWVTEAPSSEQYFSSDGRVSVQTQLVQKNADRLNRDQLQDQYVSTFLNAQNNEGQGFAVYNRYSDTEYSSALEGYVGRLSFAGSVGRGQHFSRITGEYSGLDPYAFHGGNLSDFSYQGMSMGYQVTGDHHIQFGRSVVKADRLEDRTSDFVDYSNNRFFTRYTQVSRGTEKVGYGMDVGMYVGKFDVAYQRLSSRYDISTDRLRLQWNHSYKNQFGIELSQHKNSLLDAYSDQQMMLTWRHTMGGAAPFSSSAAEQTESTEKKKKSRLGRGFIIGGAAAAALLLSSGSSGQDSADRDLPEGGLVRNVQAQHDAAQRRLNEINPVSVRENREFGGYVYQAADGSYASTVPVRGEAASVTLSAPRFAVPAGTLATASYHTHAAFDPRFDNENFSPTDLEGDRAFELDGYLGTPGGLFKYHEVLTGAISTLGTIDN